MKLILDKYRLFWQKPRRAGVNQHDRHVTFLELFYDIVYVAIISELIHSLAYNMTLEGISHFVFLFTIVWWAWFNGTIYHDLHSNNDLRTRIFTFLQMLCIVPMAIYAHDAIGEDAQEFALSYAAFEFILTIMWWRTGVHDKKHRPIAYTFAFAFLIDTILFFTSAYVDETLRYYFWFFGLLIALMLPVYLSIIARHNEAIKKQVSYITGVSASLVERYGLFIIILLGELIIGGVHSASSHNHDEGIIMTGIIGTLTAIGVWRIYFDFISHRKPHYSIKHFAVWYYLHLPLTIGISVMGATMLHIMEYMNETLPRDMQLILCSGTTIFLLCCAILIPIIMHKNHSQRFYNIASKTLIFSAIMDFILGFIPIPTLTLLSINIALFLLPFIGTNYIWWLEIHSASFDISTRKSRQYNKRNK